MPLSDERKKSMPDFAGLSSNEHNLEWMQRGAFIH
jgi:hypothetical protein